MPGQTLSFFSQISPVWWSVIIPLSLSSKRSVVVVGLRVDVLVVGTVLSVVVVVVVVGRHVAAPSFRHRRSNAALHARSRSPKAWVWIVQAVVSSAQARRHCCLFDTAS